MKKFIITLLRFYSKKIIQKYKPQTIGITGSVGKSTTKEAISFVLAAKFRIRKTTKNYNNEIGVPLAIIGVEKPPNTSLIGWAKTFWKASWLLLKKDKNYPELLVLEMGADKPGDIAYLVNMVPLNVGVLTFISLAHSEFLGSLKKIAHEKQHIISHLTSKDSAVLNFDNKEVMDVKGATKARLVTYGFKTGADLQASDVHILFGKDEFDTGINFKVQFKGNNVPIFLPGIIAEHTIPAVLAALAVGTVYGVNLVEAGLALRNYFKPLPGHMNLIPGIKKTLIIDDTYNSSPQATTAALATLVQFPLPASNARYAVLGDMLELGEHTVDAHRLVGFKVGELGINYLVTIGEASKHIAEAAIESGINKDKIYCFSDSVSAARFLQDKLKQGDIALVKGSQGLRMEKIVKEIMNNPLQAKELLVRQEEEWLKK